jgi:MarR family transcriptional regulator, 2-MHQ and catechol-resistance regulon repressor
MRLEEEIRNSKIIPPRQRSALNILFTASQIDCAFNRFLRSYGLTTPQYNILRILRGSPQGLSVLDIKERMLDRNSNVSRLVEKLRERNWVERVTSTIDRRAVVVSVTELGLELLAEIKELYFDKAEELPGRNLTEDEHSLLADLLDRFRS